MAKEKLIQDHKEKIRNDFKQHLDAKLESFKDGQMDGFIRSIASANLDAIETMIQDRVNYLGKLSELREVLRSCGVEGEVKKESLLEFAKLMQFRPVKDAKEIILDAKLTHTYRDHLEVMKKIKNDITETRTLRDFMSLPGGVSDKIGRGVIKTTA